MGMNKAFKVIGVVLGCALAAAFIAVLFYGTLMSGVSFLPSYMPYGL